MPAYDNPLDDVQSMLDKLEAELAECALQQADLATQHKASLRREEDLRKQYDQLQTELGQLGLMQLGRRMMLRAEQDSINKKLVSNRQLQSSLLSRIEGLKARQGVLLNHIGELRQPVRTEAAPAPAAAPAAPPAPAAAPAVVQAAPAPASAPRPAPARKPAARSARREAVPEMSLEEAVRHLLTRLETLYPEHQVYALDSLNADLRDRLGTLAARSGFATPADFLAAHGWQQINIHQAQALRRGKHCTPGAEPEVIRPRLESVLARLTRHYPDHVISRSIQHDHKSLAQDVSGLYVWLGYESIAAMLTAYGFIYSVPVGGRPATDIPGLLQTLRTLYAEGEKPRSITRIAADHPELAGALKTLQNQAPTRFGMSLRQYLTQEGVLSSRSR